MNFIGVDLAWGPNGGTGLCIATNGRFVESAYARTDDEILHRLRPVTEGACLVAVDAPLIISNPTGRRACERAISRCFGRHHAGARSRDHGAPRRDGHGRDTPLQAAHPLDDLVVSIAGVTIGLVLVHLDGVGAYQLAQEWAGSSSGERVTALGLVHVNETMNFALASLFNLVFAGVAFILFGLAVLLSDVYPRWLGWPALLAGVLSIGAGVVQAAVGEPTDASRVLTIIGPTIITLWLLIMGILVLRRLRDVPVQTPVA